MGKGGRKAWSIRLSDKQKNIANEAIAYLQKTEKISTRSKAFILIMERALLGFNVEETPERIRSVFESIDCEFLTWEPPNFVCNETVAKKKKGSIIGSNPSYVIERCTACKKYHLNQMIKEREKELRKDGMRKILNLRSLFLKVAKDGLEADVYICSKNIADFGTFTMSRDGVHLPCPLVDNEIVKIKDVCELAVNKTTLSTPCEYLITASHRVPIKDSDLYGFVRDGLIGLPEPRICLDADTCNGECLHNKEAMKDLGIKCPYEKDRKTVESDVTIISEEVEE